MPDALRLSQKGGRYAIHHNTRVIITKMATTEIIDATPHSNESIGDAEKSTAHGVSTYVIVAKENAA